jgi:hypothetical protein
VNESSNKTSRHESWIACLLIGLTTVLAYAPFLHQLGFYQEDLYNIWAGLTQGANSFISLFSIDRPLIGYQFALLYPLLGESPLPWHIYALFLRLCSAYALFWLLRMIWPQRKLETTVAVLLFAVYPGFLQQPQALTFQTALAALTLAILSIAFNIRALYEINRLKIVILYFFSIFFLAIYLMLMEYAIGLEALRLILIIYVIGQRRKLPLKQSLVMALKWWSPYLIAGGAFLVWRLFVYESSRPSTDVGRLLSSYSSNNLHMLLRIFVETARDFFETVAMAWVVPLYKNWYMPTYQELFVALMLILLAFAGLVLYARLKPEQQTSTSAPDGYVYADWIWIGGAAVLLGLLASVVANRNVLFEARFDRYTLPATLGVGLLLTGLIFSFLKPQLRLWAVALVVGLSLLTHYSNALGMSKFWEIQKQVWWQLSWRAPKLKEGTLLFIKLPPGSAFTEGYEAWAPANLVYYRQPGPPPITGEVLNQDAAFDIFRGGEKPKLHRNIPIHRDYSQALILSMPTELSCLHVLDGKKYEISAAEDALVQLVAAYSKIDQIETGLPFSTPPGEIFGGELEHGWCYFYQKASYARQTGDWEEITKLGAQVKQLKLGPGDRSEWMPFLEGYANTGMDKEARQLATIIKTEFGPRNHICKQLSTRTEFPAGYDFQKIVDILCK